MQNACRCPYKLYRHHTKQMETTNSIMCVVLELTRIKASYLGSQPMTKADQGPMTHTALS